MRQRPHTHPCRHCGRQVDCPFKLERNYDGWPEVICPVYHMPGGWIDAPVCEDCQRRQVDVDA